MWKEDLIRDHPEWKYYYRAFDYYLLHLEQMKILEKVEIC